MLRENFFQGCCRKVFCTTKSCKAEPFLLGSTRDSIRIACKIVEKGSILVVVMTYAILHR